MPPATLPEVAFAGRSNVGKSSAINGVLGRKSAARVSRSPGRTQAINLFEVDGRYMLADLPGYGFAKVPEAVQSRWKGMIEGYLSTRETLRLVVCLVDSRHPPQKLDLALLGGLQGAEIPFLVVATKSDKLPRSKRKSMLAKLRKGLGVPELHALSALTGEGMGELRARLLKVIQAR
jgi:GTP-binding protein